MFSREALFVLNNFVFVALFAVIFWGSFGAPIIAENFMGTNITLGADYFINVATGSQTGFYFRWKEEKDGRSPTLVANARLVTHRPDGVDFPITHVAVHSPFSFRVLVNTVLSLGLSTPIQDAMPNRDFVAVVH